MCVCVCVVCGATVVGVGVGDAKEALVQRLGGWEGMMGAMHDRRREHACVCLTLQPVCKTSSVAVVSG